MRVGLILLLLAISGFSEVAVAQDEHVAIFRNVSGGITVARDKSSLPATAGMLLLQSDIIVSGPGASAGIAFKDGTLLTVGASSEVEIRQYLFEPQNAKYGFSVYLKQGVAIYSSGKIGKLSPASVNLNTPRAAVGVRGTRFIIKTDGGVK